MSRRKNKTKKTKQENLLEAKIICYVNPVPLNRVDRQSPKYVEGKIIFSNKEKTIGYLNGHCVQYQVIGRTWHGIKDDQVTIDRMIKKVRELRYTTLVGAHHVNLYGGITGLKKYSIPV